MRLVIARIDETIAWSADGFVRICPKHLPFYSPTGRMMTAVASMDLSSALEKFGLQSFRKGQLEVIQHVISGNDCLCVMPTGGGKSLCYQLPSIVRPGLTIVVSPLIALMKDQVDSLVRRGISATLINSSLSNQEQNERLDAVASGKYSLVYVAPERLRNQRFLDAIRTTPIQLLAVDEAHCISEWGHDFRPDYQRLGKFREALGDVQTIALTATATPRVRADIVESLKLRIARQFITGFARENLFFGSVYCMSDKDKDRHLTNFLENRSESGIIYVATRKRCESLVDQIGKDLKIKVAAYHAGLMPDQRKFVQEKFMAGEIQTIVATNAFGMGIDKSDLRYVVHYNMPGTIEAYYQEAGRAGRDGLSSVCVMLFSPQDRFVQEFFIENANPTRELLQSVYEFLVRRPEDPIEFTSEEIREMIDRPATSEAINSCLQILGRTGVMERLEVAGGLAMLRLSSRLPSFIELLPKDATVRRSVLRVVERAIGDRRDEAVYVHPRWLMEQCGMDRDTLNRHLRELVKLDDFEYVPPFRGRAIHFRRRDVAFDDLKIDHQALATRKNADYEKLDQMVAYARSHKCRQRTILEYFGDMSAMDCKICDRCQGRAGWPTMPTLPSLPKQKSNSKSKSTTPAPLKQPPAVDTLVEVKSLPTAPTTFTSSIDSGESSGASENKRAKSAELIQQLLGAIERTHGYLSKTILTQHFGGTINKAIEGLRLQRLPEFGMLRHWKKSMPAHFIDLMLDNQLIALSEVRMGKLTISIAELGLKCCADESLIPEALINVVCLANQGEGPSATSSMTKAKEKEKGKEKPTKPKAVAVEPTSILEIRSAAEMPQAQPDDAASSRSTFPVVEDWRWTLCLVQHGYRLGEIALLRSKGPEAVLQDLIVALHQKQNVAIDQLFDRRTQLAIQETLHSTSIPSEAPTPFQAIRGLWQFVQEWIKCNK